MCVLWHHLPCILFDVILHAKFLATSLPDLLGLIYPPPPHLPPPPVRGYAVQSSDCSAQSTTGNYHQCALSIGIRGQQLNKLCAFCLPHRASGGGICVSHRHLMTPLAILPTIPQHPCIPPTDSTHPRRCPRTTPSKLVPGRRRGHVPYAGGVRDRSSLGDSLMCLPDKQIRF